MALALRPRLPECICNLIGEYLEPPLPPQLVELSKRWGRIVVARASVEDLIVPLYTAEEALSCRGRFVANMVVPTRAWELDEATLEELGLDYGDETVCCRIKMKTWKYDDPIPHRFEELLEPKVLIAKSEATLHWLSEWREKYKRPWPYIGRGFAVHYSLQNAWEALEESETQVERAIRAGFRAAYACELWE